MRVHCGAGTRLCAERTQLHTRTRGCNTIYSIAPDTPLHAGVSGEALRSPRPCQGSPWGAVVAASFAGLVAPLVETAADLFGFTCPSRSTHEVNQSIADESKEGRRCSWRVARVMEPSLSLWRSGRRWHRHPDGCCQEAYSPVWGSGRCGEA